ncbi:MAG: hypothetical protein R3C55_02840 [Parvularculaceae bacterium]
MRIIVDSYQADEKPLIFVAKLNVSATVQAECERQPCPKVLPFVFLFYRLYRLGVSIQ